MNTLDAILGRRSVRGFTSDPIGKETINTLIKAAAAAPSGGNIQAWAFVSIREARRVAAICSLSPGIIGLPAAVIAVCIDDRRKAGRGPEFDEMINYDLGAAMENILLAAHDMELGGCAIGSFDRKALSIFLDLPEFLKPRLLIALGKPKNLTPSPPKRAMEDFYYEESYGEGK